MVSRVRFPGEPPIYADVAELADALDLGSSAYGVGVRLPSSAPSCVSDSMVESATLPRWKLRVRVPSRAPFLNKIMDNAICGYRISVILQPSKLARWVRFPLPAPIKILSNEFEKNLDKYLLRY